MNDEARHDPPVERFRPDRSVLARAQRAMMAEEDGDHPSHRFMRQQWEAALGATRVAMDALRQVHPVGSDRLEKRWTVDRALSALTDAYVFLDELSGEMLGGTVTAVLNGTVRTHEDLDELEIPR